MNPPLPVFASPQKTSSESESATVQKQRKELQLLIAELRDRDKELNDMVAVHQRQLLAWEDDRQKILTLAERCNRLENELQKRNEIISSLTERLKLLESQEKDSKVTLENTQQKLLELSQKESNTLLHCRALEEKNQSLRCSVMEMSTKIGQLQAREQELLTMLKLKDNDILEATSHITEFTCKFKQLEHALRAAKMEESTIQKEKQDFKLRLKELICETNKLKGHLSEKTKENNEQREEIIRLKQENGYLNSELMLSAERSNRKDQLLQSAKSKQLRTDTELNSLRQIYVKQQRDLQFLHFSLESSQETKPKPKTDAHEVNSEMVLSDLRSSGDRGAGCSKTVSEKTAGHFGCIPRCVSQAACPVCSTERQRADPAEGVSASLDQLPEGLFNGQRTLSKEDSKQECPAIKVREDNGGGASPSEGLWKNGDAEISWALEPRCDAPLPIHEHWLQLDSCAGSEVSKRQSCKPREFDKPKPHGKGLEPGSVPCLPHGPVRGPDPACCCCCNFFHKGSLCHPVSDLEWLHIFKPREEEGERGAGLSSDGPPVSRAPENAKTESIPDLNILDLGAPCLTSTQKSSEEKTTEKLLDTDLPLELRSLMDVKVANGCCCPPVKQGCCSSTSKLQRLLAESRQMVADLELNSLLDACLCGSPRHGRQTASPKGWLAGSVFPRPGKPAVWP